MNLLTIDGVELEIKKHEEILKHYQFLKELKLSFVIFNAVNNKSIDEVKFCLLKTTYDDDGLRDGCYFDVVSKKHKLKYIDCEGYEIDYSDEYLQRAGVPGFNGTAFVTDRVENEGINTLRKLNEEVSNLMYGDTYIINSLSELEGVAFKPTIESIILAVCGKENFDKWATMQEKENIDLAIPKNISRTNNLKL